MAPCGDAAQGSRCQDRAGRCCRFWPSEESIGWSQKAGRCCRFWPSEEAIGWSQKAWRFEGSPVTSPSSLFTRCFLNFILRIVKSFKFPRGLGWTLEESTSPAPPRNTVNKGTGCFSNGLPSLVHVVIGHIAGMEHRTNQPIRRMLMNIASLPRRLRRRTMRRKVRTRRKRKKAWIVALAWEVMTPIRWRARMKRRRRRKTR